MVEDIEMHKSVQQGASLLAACLVVCVMGSVSSAGISVSPLKQDLTVRPGETVKFKITVSNSRRAESDTARTVRLEVMDVTVSQDGALSFQEPGSQKHSASNWVSPGTKGLTVEPGQSGIVECSLTVPYSASGEYYSAILVTLEDKGKTDKGVSVTYRIASGVFVTVKGRSFPREAKITRCEVTWPQPTAQTPSTQPASQPAGPEPAKVSVVLQNTGQARFDATGRISIADSRKRTVFTSPLTTKRSCVFGGDTRLFEAPLDRPLAVGQYVVRVDMDYQSGWAKAHYRLPLEITPEKAERLSTARKTARQAGNLPVQVTPEKLSVAMPAGAFRSLRLAIKNNGEHPLRCMTKLVFAGDRAVDASWVSVPPEEFELSKSGQKTLELVIRVPVGAAPGQHACEVLIEAGQGGTDSMYIRVPVELNVKVKKITS
jgi:hypothetical protein